MCGVPPWTTVLTVLGGDAAAAICAASQPSEPTMNIPSAPSPAVATVVLLTGVSFWLS
jgi:hypothetical protein